jgi:hypothetical protein
MHCAVRKYRVTDIDTLVQRAEEGFVPQVKGVGGFAGYYIVDGGDGTAVSITVAETADAVQESTRLAGEWVRENAAELIEGAPDVTEGEVRVSVEPG